MKIATFNTNSLRARLPIVLDWLSENTPDVLCLQETKCQDKDFPLDALDGSGYNVVFLGQKSYNGVAIFANTKMTDVVYGLPGTDPDEARFIKATVAGLHIINTYIPQGREQKSPMFAYKLNYYKQLKKYFANNFKPADKIVWTGDMNLAVAARDVHDPDGLWGSVCYCKEVQDAFADVESFGFTDCFRSHNDNDGEYTFWDYRVPNGFKRNIGWRLDYIMATNPLAKKCTKCYTDKEPREKEKPSDHTFLVAEFDI